MKKLLITGSSGHSGSQIAKLLQSSFEVIGLDRIPGPETKLIGDLTDEEFISESMKGIHYVIHTAALHAPHVATHSRKDFVDTNITGTLNLLEAASKNGVEGFVYTSTTSLYGESMSNNDSAVWITEEVQTKPRDIYDITKIAAEELCKDFFNQENLKTVVLRVSRFWDEPLPEKVFYRMYRGLDVRDVAYAHQLALETELKNFEVFNISAEPIFSQEDLHDLMHHTKEILEGKIPSIFKLYKEKDWEMPSQIDRVYVIEKAKRILGYEPKYNIKELIDSLNQEL